MPPATHLLRLAIVLTAVLLRPPGSSAQTPAPANALPDGVTPAMVSTGKELFGGKGLCLACHGPDAKGGLGPDLTDGDWLHGEGSLTEIVTRILLGVPDDESITGQSMPPKGGSTLTEEEVRAVAAYVWTLSHVASPGARAPGTKPVRR